MTGIYRGFSAKALERQYSPSSMVGDITPFIRRYGAESAAARQRLACQADIRYGPDAGQTLDILAAGSGQVPEKGAPVHVFIHGGYWRELSKDDSAFAAPGFVERGVTFVALNYSLAPTASIDRIVAQCRQGIAWLYRNIADFGGDGGRLSVSGHSAGGQLVLMLLATDWAGDYGLPETVIRGATSMSGIYDLAPLLLTTVNDPLGMDAGTARRNSPAANIIRSDVPLVIAVAERDTGEFRRQARDFAESWRKAGNTGLFLDLPGRHHFDIVFDLANPDSPLGHAVLAQAGIG